ncbi:MAG TPA: polyamine aminopropyltransferase [Dehalococcoidia bacterium]|nr:polyamine aminopropyltransferase [Dehalococcoidia bacterium]
MAREQAASAEGSPQGPFWFTEELPPYWDQNLRTQLRVHRVLHEERSPYQHIQVFDLGSFGRALLLDGIVQTTEADEFVYHEMVALLPCLQVGRPREALIIGGGDGGALRQVLRFRSLRRAVMVDLDERVVAVSRRFLPSVSQGAFDDPRAQLIIGDGLEWVRRFRRRFDVVIVDLTDPTGDGPSNPLYSVGFFQDVRRALRERGIVSVQSGSLTYQSEWVRHLRSTLAQVFPHVRLHTAMVPSYQAGLYAFLLASARPLSRLTRAAFQRRWQEVEGPPRFLSYEVYLASMALPPYLAEALEAS